MPQTREKTGGTEMECSVLRDEMLDVLYGEAGEETTRRVEEHLALCAACREELGALRRLRRELRAWPEPRLSRTRWSRPGLWPGLAAAAALLLAALGALVLSGAEARYAQGSFSLRLGRSDGELRQALAEQDQRHQRELAALQAQLAAPAESQEALLARVQELIRESEARQAVLWQASLADLGERSEQQRRYDLARVSAGLSYLEGRTGEQVTRTTELMGYLLQASQQR